ncbi:MAG: class I SAM-dependent methyltransferase [Acidimicrobiales bacterium]
MTARRNPRLRQILATGWAPDAAPADGPSGEEAKTHPMRAVTRQIAFEPDGWTPERAAKVTELFNGLAPEWNQRVGTGRLNAVADALDRGAVPGGGRCLELGSGTGFASGLLAERFAVVAAVDLSMEMLRRAPTGPAPRLLADGSRLPFRDHSVDVAVLVNMFLFRQELERVLSPAGVVVWVSSIGDRTPIYLSADDLLEALGPAWHGVASSCGEATWCVARR